MEKKEELEKSLQYIEKLEKQLGHKLPMGNNIRKGLETLQKLESEEEERKRYKDYLKGFDEEFQTHTEKQIKEIPFLINLFNGFVDKIYKPSEIQKLAVRIKIEIDNVLTSALSNEQKYLLEQWKFCEDRITNDLAEQAFIYGYAMASQAREESIKKYPYKKKE